MILDLHRCTSVFLWGIADDDGKTTVLNMRSLGIHEFKKHATSPSLTSFLSSQDPKKNGDLQDTREVWTPCFCTNCESNALTVCDIDHDVTLHSLVQCHLVAQSGW